MHNIKQLRNDINYYKKKFLERNINFQDEKFKKLDEENRSLITQKEKCEQEKKNTF